VKDHIDILKKFKDRPYTTLDNAKDYEKLMAAINKSIKLLQKHDSRKKG
jgi:hypothetical protein